jgi:heme-degrading monooxygenase HmoA
VSTEDRLAYRRSGQKGGSVITRVWRGWAPADRAPEYERHYRSEVLPVLRSVAGFEGARLLQRTTGDETEFVSLTFFDDLDSVRAFAGPDYETAVVTDEAREVLVRFDDHVGHYETAFETS